jgi:hypothetical protein
MSLLTASDTMSDAIAIVARLRMSKRARLYPAIVELALFGPGATMTSSAMAAPSGSKRAARARGRARHERGKYTGREDRPRSAAA